MAINDLTWAHRLDTFCPAVPKTTGCHRRQTQIQLPQSKSLLRILVRIASLPYRSKMTPCFRIRFTSIPWYPFKVPGSSWKLDLPPSPHPPLTPLTPPKRSSLQGADDEGVAGRRRQRGRLRQAAPAWGVDIACLVAASASTAIPHKGGGGGGSPSPFI